MARTPRTPGMPAPRPEPVMEAPREDEAGLPDADSVDAWKITAPVLTRQGWVCPAEQPRRGPF